MQYLTRRLRLVDQLTCLVELSFACNYTDSSEFSAKLSYKDLLPSMGEFDMSSDGARKKTVTFSFERNTEHKTLSFYPKGPKKPAKASNPNLHSVPVDLEEKALVKAYLENEVEQYQGYVLMQYINNQDGSYQLKFADPVTKERYLQSFTQESIDEIITAAKKLHSIPSTKPN